MVIHGLDNFGVSTLDGNVLVVRFREGSDVIELMISFPDPVLLYKDVCHVTRKERGSKCYATENDVDIWHTEDKTKKLCRCEEHVHYCN